VRRRITRVLAIGSAGDTITTLGLSAGPAGAAVHRAATSGPSAPVVVSNADCTPSTPPVPADNCPLAGYVASGRDFRYAQALITVPNFAVTTTAIQQLPLTVGAPQIYVALDASTSATYSFVRAGISLCAGSQSPVGNPQAGDGQPCPPSSSGWVAYAEDMRNGTAVDTQFVPISAAALGDRVLPVCTSAARVSM
jgi:hypothetical protein